MRRVLLAVLLVMVAACSSSSKPNTTAAPTTTTAKAAAGPAWPAPSDPMARAKEAGLVPEDAEQLQYHVHAHLDVFVDGARVTVPAGLGIDITNPGVHTFKTPDGPAYGGISVPCATPCISPLHTHDTTGILHTESSTHVDNTLGQLLIEWHVTLPPAAKAYVDGKLLPGDPRTIALSNHKEIAIVIGTPPSTIPSTADFSAA